MQLVANFQQVVNLFWAGQDWIHQLGYTLFGLRVSLDQLGASWLILVIQRDNQWREHGIKCPYTSRGKAGKRG